MSDAHRFQSRRPGRTCHPERYSAKDLAPNDGSRRCFGVSQHDIVWMLLTLSMLALTGCAPKTARENLPHVHFRDDREALHMLAERADAVKTLSAQGTITLTRPDGESVRLDLAMVRAGRDRLRMRAWKLGRAVFDLTMNGGDVWLLTADDASLKTRARSAGLSARRLAPNIRLLGGDLFRRPDAIITDATRMLRVSAPDGDHVLICEVDRRTLTPRKYVLQDSAGGSPRFTLELSDYSADQDIPVPRRMVARSEDGTIAVSLREVEVNGELAEGAFVPPKRAEKLP
jgi:outer membrane lipoprotein-sorting protein